jgi:ATP-dependent Zn protease
MIPVEHEEAWWMLCLISYHQLYLARLLTSATPYPWEKYLPAYQKDAQKNIVTPTQAQRGFANLLEKIGSPARFCVARGRLSGRLVGMTQEKRAKEFIQFKAKKKVTAKTISQLKTFISRLEKSTINSCPEKLDDMVNLVQTLLSKNNYSAQEFIDLLNNSS